MIQSRFDRGVQHLVTHDRAGERVLEDLLVDAEQRLADDGIGGDIYLFKNNTDSAGNSYGCHENYLVSRGGDLGRLADLLVPFLIRGQQFDANPHQQQRPGQF